MKVEMFYGESWLGYSVDEFMDAIDDCIRWYNETRIKSLLGGLSPTRGSGQAWGWRRRIARKNVSTPAVI